MDAREAFLIEDLAPRRITATLQPILSAASLSIDLASPHCPPQIQPTILEFNSSRAGKSKPQRSSEFHSVDTYDASDGSTALTSVSGQWTAYAINVAATNTYTLTARVASPYSGSAFHVEVDGVNKTGSIYIPNTGSWDSYQNVSLDNISLDAGQHNMTVVIESGGGNVDYLSWSVYQYQSCQPTSGDVNACHHNGGEWDYDLCYCVYY